MLIGLPKLSVADESLSETEKAVVSLALDGLSNREIAQRRSVSARTVSNQLRSAYEKLEVRSRFELAAKLLADGA